MGIAIDNPVVINKIDTQTSTPYTNFAYASTITPLTNTNIRVLCTGNLIINSPVAASDGALVRLWIAAIGGDRTVSIQSTIKIPTTSSFTNPQTITSGNKARLAIQYDATRASWELVTFVNGY